MINNEPNTYKPANTKFSILIVEDDPYLSKMYSEKFTIEGFQVFIAKNELEFGEVLESNEPQAILLDLMLPDINGLNLVTKYKNRLQNIVIIALTNSTNREHLQTAFNLGIKEYLTKAMFTPEQVVEKVMKYLR